MLKFSQNDKKKKNALCYNTPNIFQCKCILIYEIPNIKIQSNLKRRKHEKTHPFINFRIAFGFHFER
ncbi:hypothetical protein F7208_07960 [Helicobacter pylori]|nr:hypothetical protein [Helicobacter pylori]